LGWQYGDNPSHTASHAFVEVGHGRGDSGVYEQAPETQVAVSQGPRAVHTIGVPWQTPPDAQISLWVHGSPSSQAVPGDAQTSSQARSVVLHLQSAMHMPGGMAGLAPQGEVVASAGGSRAKRLEPLHAELPITLTSSAATNIFGIARMVTPGRRRTRVIGVQRVRETARGWM
jgi:hypothetical protein